MRHLPFAVSRYLPRMTLWSVISAFILSAIWIIAPEQLQVVLYKAGLVTVGAVLSYWLDRALFVNGRPHKCGTSPETLHAAWLRRALVAAACILGMTLGL